MLSLINIQSITPPVQNCVTVLLILMEILCSQKVFLKVGDFLTKPNFYHNQFANFHKKYYYILCKKNVQNIDVLPILLKFLCLQTRKVIINVRPLLTCHWSVFITNMNAISATVHLALINQSINVQLATGCSTRKQSIKMIYVNMSTNDFLLI